MIDGHSFNFLAIESGPSNPPTCSRNEEMGGGKNVKWQKRNFTLSTKLSHSLPTSVFSCLKFGEILPKLVDFTLKKKKAIKKISQFLCQKIAKYHIGRKEKENIASNVQQGVSLTVAFCHLH
jgi:hypothetical protein